MTKLGVMENFSTTVDSARLTPNAVLSAAREDFKRLARNQLRQAGEIQALDFEHFAFHRTHVHRAAKAAAAETAVIELLRFALKFQSIGMESGKRNTRLIYRDVPTLQAAYELAGGTGVVEKAPETQEKEPVNEG